MGIFRLSTETKGGGKLSWVSVVVPLEGRNVPTVGVGIILQTEEPIDLGTLEFTTTIIYVTKGRLSVNGEQMRGVGSVIPVQPGKPFTLQTDEAVAIFQIDFR